MRALPSTEREFVLQVEIDRGAGGGAKGSGAGRSTSEDTIEDGDATAPRGKGKGNAFHQVHAPSSAEKWIPTCKFYIAIEKNISCILSSSFSPSFTRSFRHGFLIIA